MPRLRLFALAALVSANAAPAPAQTVTRSDLKPGLVFTARDGGSPDSFTVTRTEPNVALNLAAGEAPHPQSTGGSEFRWVGFVNVLQPGKYTFTAVLVGAVEVEVGGKVVLKATNPSDAAAKQPGGAVELAAGMQPFVATLRRTDGQKAVRLELFWTGPAFQPEPMPYFVFGHLPKQRPPSFTADRAKEHGRFLFEELSCARCHRPDPATAKTLADRAGPNLTEIGRRAYPGWLDAWLADPQKLRPHTTMPKMFTDDTQGKAQRYAVVAYLASLGGPVPAPKSPNANDARRSVRDGERLYVTTGCAACHGEYGTGRAAKTTAKDDPDADEMPVLRPEDSVYALGTPGPQGQYALGAVGSKWSPESLAKYLQNPPATNPHGRMPNMMLSGQEAHDIARFLCWQTDRALARELPGEPKLEPTDVAADALKDSDKGAEAVRGLSKRPDQWKELGKQILTVKGCVNCHAAEPGGAKLPTVTAPSLNEVRKGGAARGCLAAEPEPGTVPAYKLTDTDRANLAAFLKDGLTGPGSPAPAYHGRVALRRFRCLNCHQRDGEGGFRPELADRMRLLEKAETADDVAPPRLTSVGHKLRTAWLTEVLTKAGRARPWMTLRMPQYGDAHVRFLADALPKLEGTVPGDAVGNVEITAAKIETGRALIGKGGHGCVSCHDISGVQTGGTRGPDLATTSRRVRYDWYAHWMHQPQRLAPGTRMPQYFPDGKALLTTVLNGNPDAQIEAMWAYLSLGPGLPLPAGMEPPKGVIVAVKDRPEILRTFMPEGAGTKAIAVGYPGGVSVVFDGAACRLGYAWTGNFLDVTPVWSNRGGAPAKLLGPTFWTAPPGFPWAVTVSPGTVPDFAARAKEPAYGHQLPNDEFYNGPRAVRFEGYALDDAGRPTFRYTLTDADGHPQLTVAEKPEPLPVTVAAGLKRSFALGLPAGRTAWLNVGVAAREPQAFGPSGATVMPGGSDVPAVGSRLVLPADGDRATVVELAAAPADAVWRFVPSPTGGWQVLLRLPEAPTASKAGVTLLTWGLPRVNDELLKGLKAR